MRSGPLPTFLMALALAAPVVGCGGNTAPMVLETVHGGRVFDLPDARGVVEVVRQDLADQPGACQLTVYYLDADKKPLSAAPTAATLKTRGRPPQTIEFKPAAGSDPAKAGALESSTIKEASDIEGELTATIDGKPVAVMINVR